MQAVPFKTTRGGSWLLPAIAGLLLGGCALTPPHPPEPVLAPAAFKEAGPWHPAATEVAVPDAWWTLFRDPVLDDLESRLVIGNQNLKAVAAQVSSARAALEASRTAGLPTLSGGLSASRSGNPDSSTGIPVVNSRGPSNSVSLSASASWEIDLWGRLSQASVGAQAQLQASAD
ncbi:MAG: TolC family protein, partial [Burkholderiaceae bacterium]